MIKLLAIVTFLILTSGNVAQASGDVIAGKAKSTSCIACHGEDGNSPVNPLWPKLAGQHKGYIEKQLMAFRSGTRKNQLMTPVAAPLTDQDIKDLAAYYNSQSQTGGSAAASQVNLGQKIYRAGNPVSNISACMSCHGPRGLGNGPAIFPQIAGQHAAYIEKSLKDYRSGIRQTDPNAIMRTIAVKMTDEEISAVAQYIQGLY